jgi:hypothetical protein
MFYLLAATSFALLPQEVPAAAPGPVLTGVVQDEKGRPVAAATVFIDTAGPRKGVGVL